MGAKMGNQIMFNEQSNINTIVLLAIIWYAQA